jgi:hypothetical protein
LPEPREGERAGGLPKLPGGVAVKKRATKAAVVTAVLIGAGMTWTLFAQAGDQSGQALSGGGTSIVSGGTGKPSFTPILTKFAFHVEGGVGRFECLALAPSTPAGSPGSGNFDTNIMYVTGRITSVQIHDRAAVARGTADVTGAGAGSDRPFTVTATRGGPGASLVLVISGLTFNEMLLEGEITF